MNKVMLVGKNGQVGRELAQRLIANKFDVLALDRQELDITQGTDVMRQVLEFGPNFIVNCAAYTAVDRAESEVEAAYQGNELGPKNLALAANESGAVLLHLSTDYVFSGSKDGSYCELDPVAPSGVYGASKLAGEKAIAETCRQHIILRTAWVFGAQGNNFVKTMLRLGRERDSLGVVDDQRGGPTYAGDIAAAIITIIQGVRVESFDGWGVYHFSGFPYVSWFDFASAIFAEAEKQSLLSSSPVLTPLSSEQYPTPAERPKNSCLDGGKITQVFGVEPSNWSGALKQLANYSE